MNSSKNSETSRSRVHETNDSITLQVNEIICPENKRAMKNHLCNTVDEMIVVNMQPGAFVKMKRLTKVKKNIFGPNLKITK